MRPPPRSLPGADSRKWHSRRWWDPLGYLRVRSLANPRWQRDVPWLLRFLERTRAETSGAERSALDDAVRALRRYHSLPPNATDDEREGDWDRMLEAIDRHLTLVQEAHLAAVDEAGASGRRRRPSGPGEP